MEGSGSGEEEGGGDFMGGLECDAFVGGAEEMVGDDEERIEA